MWLGRLIGWRLVTNQGQHSMKVITDTAELKDLPPGRYILSGEAAAEHMRGFAMRMEAERNRQRRVKKVKRK
jgi:hypothetical protein